MELNISILAQNLIPEQLPQTKFSEFPVYQIRVQKSLLSIKELAEDIMAGTHQFKMATYEKLKYPKINIFFFYHIYVKKLFASSEHPHRMSGTNGRMHPMLA